MTKTKTTRNRHRIEIGIGYASFSCEGDQSFIDRCLALWYRELKQIYGTPRKMVNGDLYARI